MVLVSRLLNNSDYDATHPENTYKYNTITEINPKNRLQHITTDLITYIIILLRIH